MLHKRFLPIKLIMISMLVISACGNFGAPKTVKVAVTFPLVFEFCQDMANAAQLAVDEVNGKAGAVQVEMVVFDTSDPDPAIDDASDVLELQFATQVANDPAFVAQLGPPFSSMAKISIPVLNKGKIAQISSLATWPGLTKPGYGPGEPVIYYPTGEQTFFRTVPSDDVQGASAARWAKALGYKTVYILSNTDPYAVGVSGIFEVTAKDVGLEVLAHEVYGNETEVNADINEILDRVIAANPDVVYLAGGLGFGGDDIIKTLRLANPDLAIMVPDSLVHDELISLVGADPAEGVYGTTVGIAVSALDTPSAAAFAKSYKAAYGKDPTPPEVTTYEAMKVLLYAIEHAKQPTRQGVLDAMQNMGDYSGVLGDWHFDEQGDISLAVMSGMQIQDGKWVFVQAVK